MAIEHIYHGSDHVIERPEYGKGKPYNDYGLGFYCARSEEMANEWAVGPERNGYSNEYSIDFDGLELIDLQDERFCILHWIAILLENRTFTIDSPLAAEARDYLTSTFAVPYRQADAIIGYRADDSYFAFAQDFLNGTISIRQLGNAMRLGKLGLQVVIKSERAFERLEFEGEKPVFANTWYPRKEQRDREARSAYFDRERNGRKPGDLFIGQIIDEGVTADDPRVR